MVLWSLCKAACTPRRPGRSFTRFGFRGHSTSPWLWSGVSNPMTLSRLQHDRMVALWRRKTSNQVYEVFPSVPSSAMTTMTKCNPVSIDCAKLFYLVRTTAAASLRQPGISRNGISDAALRNICQTPDRRNEYADAMSISRLEITYSC